MLQDSQWCQHSGGLEAQKTTPEIFYRSLGHKKVYIGTLDGQ